MRANIFFKSSLLFVILFSTVACMKQTNQKPVRITHHRATNATLSPDLNHHTATLLKQLAHTKTTIIHQDKDKVRLIFPEETNFKPNSSTVNLQLMSILEVVAQTFKKCPYSTLTIHGYADSQGPNKINQALSERRAHAVMAYLKSHDMPANHLVTVGHSEAKPRTVNSTKHGRHVNRRVEITIHQSSKFKPFS